MKWKPAIVLAALSVALSFVGSMPATAASDKAPESFRASGLMASAEFEPSDGGRGVLQIIDGVQINRTPGSKPIREALPAGVAAMSVPGPYDDPTVQGRELWCILDDKTAVSIARDLTSARAEFTCEGLFIDVVCNAWEGEECVGVDEIENGELKDTITVAVTWEGVGALSRTVSISRSFGPDWWLSNTKGTHRMATASGSIRGLETTYFEGTFDSAELAAMRDASLQHTPAEPEPEP